jgi:hypothetical protein
MAGKDKDIEWLVKQTQEYRSQKSNTEDVVEELGDMGNLGQGFSSIDKLEEIDIGESGTGRPMFLNVNLGREQKEEMWALLKEFVDCFAWEYTEMPSLG